jgi:hypothetical protein
MIASQEPEMVPSHFAKGADDRIVRSALGIRRSNYPAPLPPQQHSHTRAQPVRHRSLLRTLHSLTAGNPSPAKDLACPSQDCKLTPALHLGISGRLEGQRKTRTIQ